MLFRATSTRFTTWLSINEQASREFFMKPAYGVWGLILLLIIAHQDIWFWEDTTLVFGFLPMALAYHAGISLAAAFTWYLATQFCWPTNQEPSAQRKETP